MNTNGKNWMITLAVFVLALPAAFGQDVDGDGVADAFDNCKYTYNPNQADMDADAIGDVCDCDSVTSNPTGQRRPAIVILASPSANISPGTHVQFTTAIDAGGTSPAYQWTKNGLNVGSNSAAYLDSQLQNGDVVKCILTSDVSCTTGSTGTSNAITMTVSSMGTQINAMQYFAIYPNPAQKELFFSAPNSIESVEIINPNGRTIQTLRVINNRIELISLSSGFYILKANAQEQSAYKSLFIE